MFDVPTPPGRFEANTPLFEFPTIDRQVPKQSELASHLAHLIPQTSCMILHDFSLPSDLLFDLDLPASNEFEFHTHRSKCQSYRRVRVPQTKQTLTGTSAS